jgi:hypothetical protein
MRRIWSALGNRDPFRFLILLSSPNGRAHTGATHSHYGEAARDEVSDNHDRSRRQGKGECGVVGQRRAGDQDLHRLTDAGT